MKQVVESFFPFVESPPDSATCTKLPPDFVPFDFDYYLPDEWTERKWELFACVPLLMWFAILVMW